MHIDWWWMVAMFVAAVALLWLVVCGAREWRIARRAERRRKAEEAAQAQYKVEHAARWYGGDHATRRAATTVRKPADDVLPIVMPADDGTAFRPDFAPSNPIDFTAVPPLPMQGGGGTFDGGGASASFDSGSSSSSSGDTGSCSAPSDP